MIADVVRNVGGAHVSSESLIAPGVDPHLYKPTRKDIASVLRADVVFYNGLYLEGKMIDALNRAKASGRKIYAIGEQIDPTLLIKTDEFSGQVDPHLWMDPATWEKTIDFVRDRLSEELRSEAASIAENAENYRSQINLLDSYCEKILATIPEQKRILVTAHDAFNYFGRRYGFEVIGIQGLSTESEAGVKDIERIISTLVAQKISAVFIESTVSDKNIKALLEGAKAQGHHVVIGGSLFSDAMGAANTYEGTYIGMLDHNATTITIGLGGSAPKAGLNTRLGE
ncbi:UNVERIFIED_CONTAM: hypothetical protein GTU68_003307 [Idotea baltica]|nr:hypothetical protein [Idotea baltica]